MVRDIDWESRDTDRSSTGIPKCTACVLTAKAVLPPEGKLYIEYEWDFLARSSKFETDQMLQCNPSASGA